MNARVVRALYWIAVLAIFVSMYLRRSLLRQYDDGLAYLEGFLFVIWAVLGTTGYLVEDHGATSLEKYLAAGAAGALILAMGLLHGF